MQLEMEYADVVNSKDEEKALPPTTKEMLRYVNLFRKENLTACNHVYLKNTLNSGENKTSLRRDEDWWKKKIPR